MGGEDQWDGQVIAIASFLFGGILHMIFSMRRAWESQWEAHVRRNNISVCFRAEGLKEHRNRLGFAIVVGFQIVPMLSRDRQSLLECRVGGVMVLECANGHEGGRRA
jgi:hypothetical protein